MLYRMVALVLDGLVGFPAGLSPTCFHLSPSSFHLSPISFHLSPRLLLVVGLPAGLSPTCFFHLSVPCGRVPGSLVSHLLSRVSQFFSCVSQAGCLWSGSRLACLPLTSFHSPKSLLLGVLNALQNGRLGAGWSGRVPGRLVSHFLSFVSQFFSFVSQAGCLWSGSRLLVSQAGCLWSGCRLACLPLPFICLPLLFTCLPVLFICLPRFWSGWMVWSDSRPACLPLPFICLPVLFVCPRSGFPAGLSPTSFYSPIAMLWGLAKLIGGRAPLGHRQSWWADGVPVMF